MSVTLSVTHCHKERDVCHIDSEHKIQNEIILKLSENGCHIFRSNAGKIRTESGRTIMLFPKGFPDLCGYRDSDGKFICIEVKNKTGRLRHDQEQFAVMIKNFPVLYGVARSTDDALKIIGG